MYRSTICRDSFRSHEFPSLEEGVSVLVYGSRISDTAVDISIVIPTYGRPQTLKSAINSVLMQTEHNVVFELLVVDNEFSPNYPSQTEVTVRSFIDTRMVYYQNKENLGMAGNWNQCVLLAQGKWVSFLHDDDLLMPDYFRKITHLINKKKDIAGIMAAYVPFSNDQDFDLHLYKHPEGIWNSIKERIFNKKMMRLTQRDSILTLADTFGPPTCGSLYLRECIMALGGFDQSLYPSFDWFFLFEFSGQFKLYRSFESLGYYRTENTTSGLEETKKKFLEQRVFFQEEIASKTRLGRIMKKLFGNEQNYVILNASISDYIGKETTNHYPAEKVKISKIRLLIYENFMYWYLQCKKIFCLLWI